MKRLALAHVALLVAWACHSTGCDSTARFARADGDDKYDARARRDSLQVGSPIADAALAPGSVSTDSHRLGALTPWGTQATVTAMTPPVVYVRDFGAKGDGVTDDTAAINEAIASMTRGGTLVFDPGKTYRKNANVVVSKPGVKLWGSARSCTPTLLSLRSTPTSPAWASRSRAFASRRRAPPSTASTSYRT